MLVCTCRWRSIGNDPYGAHLFPLKLSRDGLLRHISAHFHVLARRFQDGPHRLRSSSSNIRRKLKVNHGDEYTVAPWRNSDQESLHPRPQHARTLHRTNDLRLFLHQGCIQRHFRQSLSRNGHSGRPHFVPWSERCKITFGHFHIIRRASPREQDG